MSGRDTAPYSLRDVTLSRRRYCWYVGRGPLWQRTVLLLSVFSMGSAPPMLEDNCLPQQSAGTTAAAEGQCGILARVCRKLPAQGIRVALLQGLPEKKPVTTLAR